MTVLPRTAPERVAADLPGLSLAKPLQPFNPVTAGLDRPVTDESRRTRKLCSSLEDAIRRSGLKDGDTISFHHHFRGGDQLVVPVVAKLAELGFRNLTLAPSSLHDAHAGLIPYIREGVITRLYTSGLRGDLAKALSAGLLAEPVTIHSHGTRVAMLQTGEIHIDVAFLGVSAADNFGNANGVTGRSHCGSLGYAMVDAKFADTVVVVTEELLPYPNQPAAIRQDQVDLVVQMDDIGDPAKIATGAARLTRNPRELLIAKYAADVMEHSGLFVDGFSMQTGAGVSSIAATDYLEARMVEKKIRAGWALGGLSGQLVGMQDRGLIGTILDTQDFDVVAADHLYKPGHHEISTDEYANPLGKGAAVDQLDMVILSALEVDLDFNVNVMTGSDGVMMGAAGGHPDTAFGAKLTIITAPLLRGRLSTVVENVTTLITPGVNIDVLVTDCGIAVNPIRPELAARLTEAGLPVVPLERLHEIAVETAGRPRPIEFGDQVVGVVRYRDGSVLDTIHNVIA